MYSCATTLDQFKKLGTKLNFLAATHYFDYVRTMFLVKYLVYKISVTGEKISRYSVSLVQS